MSPDRFTVDALMTHEGLVRGLARSILKGDDRSEDVVQETWATALRTSPRDPGALGRWLGTISRRLALRVKRSDESRQRRESAPRGRSAVPTPAEIAEREETRRAVLRALLDLDPLYRDVLLLRFYEDLPPREVAAHLGVPVETARSRIRRGIASLRRTLRSRYGDRQRALPLALVLLAEAPTPAAAFPALLAMKTAAVVLALAGAGTGLVALADPGPDPAPSPPAHHAAPPPNAPAPTATEVDDDPAPPPGASAPKSTSPFAGMVRIPGGPFRMGIDEDRLLKLLEGHRLLRGPDREIWIEMLRVETPEHEVVTEECFVDVHTVTNAQYRRFLEDSQKSTFVTKSGASTIARIAAEVHGEASADPWLAESIFWINEARLLARWKEIRAANESRIRDILGGFNQFLPKPAWKKTLLDLPDKQRAEGWVTFRLPKGLSLTVYARPIPDHWKKGVLPKGRETSPVVWVTAEDADAYAAWAGKHVVTEAEWERGARGPQGWLWPWGPTWNWSTQRNFLVWMRADPWPKGPAAPFLNLPVDVTRCAGSASPYGLMHMLGNVREWTSSVPVLYPGSTAKKRDWHGSAGCRVLRSTSYGDGQVSGDGKRRPFLELMHRNTARALEGSPGAGIGVTARFAAVGFRCAKDPQPARDVLAHRVARLEAEGALSPKLGLDLPRTLGMEKVDDAPEATDTVFVLGRTLAIGFVPLKKIVELDGVEVLGWLWWNADVKLRVANGAPIGCGPRGLLVGRRDGELGFFAPAARGPELVGVPLKGEPAPALRPAGPSDVAPGLTFADGTIVIRVDHRLRDGTRHLTRRLTLPLRFEGPDLPTKAWRK